MKFRSRIAVGLISVITYGFFAPAAFAITNRAPESKSERVRIGLARVGTGEDARVALRLKDGSRVGGYISSTDAEAFTVADLKTGTRRSIRYSDIAHIRAHNLTTGQKYAIGTAIIVALLLALAYAARGA